MLENVRNKKKCRHEEVIITEHGIWVTQHNREKDGEWSHNNDPADYQATIRVECRECGLDRKYNRFHAPKWLQKYLEELDK